MAPNIEKGKILIITDVHARIKEMNQFFNWLICEQGENIQFGVHLGDFWGGRNYKGSTQVRMKFDYKKSDYLDNLEIPLFHLKGNEDLEAPEEAWISENSWLMADQEPFYLGPYKVLPIYFQEKGTPEDKIPKNPHFTSKDDFDFIFSHRPPFGLLDNTLHAKTHEILKNIGSPLVREYYDRIKPSVLFFGHNHYTNFLETDYGIIISLDKLIRTSKRTNAFKYTYSLVDPFHQTIEVVWKNKLFLKYNILEKKIKFLNNHKRKIL